MVVSGANRRSANASSIPGPLSETEMTTARGASLELGSDADGRVGPGRFGNRLDCITHEIEHHLLELDSIAVDIGDIVGDVQRRWRVCLADASACASVRASSSMSRTSIVLMCGWPRRRNSRIRRTTPLGMIDLSDHGRQIVRRRGSGRGLGMLNEMLGRTGERPGGGHRLVDLVGERRGHAAHQVEPRRLRRLGFLRLEPCARPHAPGGRRSGAR